MKTPEEIEKFIENTITESRDGSFSSHDANLRGSIEELMLHAIQQGRIEGAKSAATVCLSNNNIGEEKVCHDAIFVPPRRTKGD